MHKSANMKKLSVLLVLAMMAMMVFSAIPAFADSNPVSNVTVSGPANSYTPVAIGSNVTFTANCTDTASNPEYQFWVIGPSTNYVWTAVQDYSSTNTFTMSNLAAGSYTVAVYAMDKSDVDAGNWANAVYADKTYVLNVGSTVSLNASYANGQITATASSTNIHAARYQFWYQDPVDATKWTASGDYSTSNTFTFTPATPGTYNIVVYACDPNAPQDWTHSVSAKTSVGTQLEVQSVSALNGSQIQVVFSKPVDSATAQAPASYSLVGATFASAVLQSDGQTVLINLNPAISNATPTPVAVTINGVKSKDLSETAPLYTKTITVADTTSPTIVSVVSNSGSGNATSAKVTFSEPVSLAGSIFKLDGAVVVPVLDPTNTIGTISGLSLDPSKEHALVVLNLKDLSGNMISPNPTTVNFNVIQNVNAPTASVSAYSDTNILVTFSTKMDPATVTAANISVKDELLNNVPIGAVTPLPGDATGTKFLVPITDPTMYNTKTSRTYTVVFTNNIKDQYGNAMVATTAPVTLTKDTTAPAITGTNFNKDVSGKVTNIVLTYSKGLAASAGYSTTGVTVVDANGVDRTVGFFAPNSNPVSAGDTQVTIPLTAATALSGKYTFTFPAGFVTDTALTPNQSAASTQVIDFGNSANPPAALTVTLANAGTNKFTATYSAAVKGGAVTGSATDPGNYSLNGAAMPAGTTITLDPTMTVATITLPANSIAKSDPAALLSVSGVQTAAGATVTPTVTPVAVVDNVPPVLQSAQAVDNATIVLTFSEDVTVGAATDVKANFTINENGVALAPATITADPVPGFDNKVKLTLPAGTLDLTKPHTITTAGASPIKDTSALLNPVTAGTTVAVN
ncbi:Ig-like domain-containing protein [Desulfotomaculum copahuensis]|uniref:SbsA Ig-like domain-containing protein n=1 Tax=Desulfotomaculum copahuensis TaxID=1838280 RepID=A0A1B7LBP5_9FIRM|nr:Ig-like domain-containing protein [Desulfotomaculum copahuensis]OAT79904.1 hypothetical protein A6M21_14425 [Desulfotomaculum copahuensis]